MAANRSKIAVFSEGCHHSQHSFPGNPNKAREKHWLPLIRDPNGAPVRFDALRPQRLAAAVTVYTEKFSALPLESDAAELYTPAEGQQSLERKGGASVDENP